MTQPAPARHERTGTSVGGYLAQRLQQLGVDHLFGLPGDYNLALIDEMLATSTLTWVGCGNELNAGYAADGYARVRGMGALLTTYGVGELSAINAVAGSYAESVPVVQITGAPSGTLAEQGALLHHTLADRDFGHFERAYREVTAAAEVLTSVAPGRQIDQCLTVARDHVRPVYLSVPADLVHTTVSSAPVKPALSRSQSDPRALTAFTRALRGRLGAHPQVTLLAGHLLSRRNLAPEVRRLADLGVAVATLTSCKGILDEDHPCSLGTYIGALTPSVHTRATVEKSPALVLAGTALTDLVTGLFSHRIDLRSAIVLDLHQARLDSVTYPGIELRDSVGALLGLIESDPDSAQWRPLAASATTYEQAEDISAGDGTAPLTQAQLWLQLESWIAPGTRVLADSGTAYYGAAGLRLPPDCTLEGQPTWSSIGYTLPALLGTQLADPAHPALLVIGDGAAQLTFQELATILHHSLKPVIVLINNGGYTIERAIRSPDAPYHDISAWAWTRLPSVLGAAERVRTLSASTSAELAEALRQAGHERDEGQRAVLIEVVLGRYDTPPLLAALADGLGNGAR